MHGPDPSGYTKWQSQLPQHLSQHIVQYLIVGVPAESMAKASCNPNGDHANGRRRMAAPTT
jgi:hypothetical protein